MEKPPGPHLERVCSVCHRRLGWKPCAPELDGQASHGYCDPCADHQTVVTALWLLMERVKKLDLADVSHALGVAAKADEILRRRRFERDAWK